MFSHLKCPAHRKWQRIGNWFEWIPPSVHLLVRIRGGRQRKERLCKGNVKGRGSCRRERKWKLEKEAWNEARTLHNSSWRKIWREKKHKGILEAWKWNIRNQLHQLTAKYDQKETFTTHLYIYIQVLFPWDISIRLSSLSFPCSLRCYTKSVAKMPRWILGDFTYANSEDELFLHGSRFL